MAKVKVGVDVGTREMKLAALHNGKLECISLKLPEKMVEDGIVTMPLAMTDFLKAEKKRVKFPKGEMTMVLPESSVFFRRLNTPYVTEEQLLLNLPYEFRDYVGNDTAKYNFDYALEEVVTGEDGKPVSMNILAAAAPKEMVSGLDEILRSARLPMETAIPRELAFTALSKLAGEEPDREVAFLDLGHTAVRMYIFVGNKLAASRTLDIGCQDIDQTIASVANVDVFVANSRKEANLDNILNSEAVQDTYDRIAIEVMKALNFYRFNNRESALQDIYFCGGGSEVEPLIKAITERIDLSAHDLSELLPGDVSNLPYRRCAGAIGAALY